jgi:catechol 2,3-dioxygenase-like lactoylglutathione lyase family enzyme
MNTPQSTRPEIRGASPFLIVRNVLVTLEFYRDQMGFEIAFRQPTDDPFFGIVNRGGATLMVKAVRVDPLPNR